MAGSLSGHVLVLNRLWQAVNIVGVRRGLTLLFQDHARVLHSEGGQFREMDLDAWIAYSMANPPASEQHAVQTVRFAMRVPTVLLLRSFDRVPVREVRFSKEGIFERDGYRCQYCGQELPSYLLNLDHVIPRDLGGRTCWENIVTSCKCCNTKKANRMPHQAGMVLLSRPVRPKSRVIIQLNPDEVEADWACFLPNTKRVHEVY